MRMDLNYFSKSNISSFFLSLLIKLTDDLNLYHGLLNNPYYK